MKANYQIDHGLIVNTETTPPTCCGYIFNFQGHGTFAPDGKVKVGDAELTEREVAEHNRLLGEAEWGAMLKHGRAVLYFNKDKDSGRYTVTNCVGTKKVYCYDSRTSLHFTPNTYTRVERMDLWFMLDGSRWHGVHLGDNCIVRVKRCKTK